MKRPANTVRLPAGARDFLPRSAARRRAIADDLIAVFESWGYDRIITPVVEIAEVLDRGLGEQARAAAVRFVEPMSGEVVALRPDITPQVARIAATRLAPGHLPSRLCYEGPVTRLNLTSGGQREILQAGIELLDAPSPEGDAEALAVAAAALQATQLGEVRIDLGHVAFTRFAVESCPAAHRAELLRALTRKDMHGVSAIAGRFPRAARDLVAALPHLYGARSEVLGRARALRLPAILDEALSELESVLRLSAMQLPDAVHRRISLDLGEVRGFDYYTGLRFRGFADGVGQAVLRGGRYDELVGKYGRDAAATGFAIDVEAVAEAQDGRGIAPPERARGLCIIVPPGKRKEAQQIGGALRAHGHRVAVQVAPGGSAARVAGEAQHSGWSHVLSWSRAWWGLEASGDEKRPMDGPASMAARGRIGAIERWLTRGD